MVTMDAIYKALATDCPSDMTETICAQNAIISIYSATFIEDAIKAIDETDNTDFVKNETKELLSVVEYYKFMFPYQMASTHTEEDIQKLRDTNDLIFDLIVCVSQDLKLSPDNKPDVYVYEGLFRCIIAYVCIMSVYAHYNSMLGRDFVGELCARTRFYLEDVDAIIESARKEKKILWA